MKGVFKRVGLTLVPASAEGCEALLAVKNGATCMADVRGARNPLQHNLFWKLAQLVADADDDHKDNVKEWLLRQLAFVDTFFDPDGTMHIKTKSIAYEKMEQVVFTRFFDACIPLISQRLGAAPADILKQFESLLNPEERAAYWQLRKVRSPSIAPESDTHERADERELAQVGRGQ